MRYAIVPNPILLKNPQSGENHPKPTSFRDYAMQFWADDARWQKPMSNMARLVVILKEIDKHPGELMEFEDADFRVLLDIVNNPAVGQAGNPILPSPMYYLQLKSFPDVISEASSVKPVVANGKLLGEATVLACIEEMHANPS